MLSQVPFHARFDGMAVLDALEAIQDGSGHSEIAALPLWESEVMMVMRMTEEEYLKLSRVERARKVMTVKYKDWFGMLEHDLWERTKEKK